MVALTEAQAQLVEEIVQSASKRLQAAGLDHVTVIHVSPQIPDTTIGIVETKTRLSFACPGPSLRLAARDIAGTLIEEIKKIGG